MLGWQGLKRRDGAAISYPKIVQNMSTSARTWRILSAILLGVGFFGILMGAAIMLIRYNVASSPEFAWFPLPVTAILLTGAWLAERYGRIGFARPQPVPLPTARVWVISTLITIAGVMACAFQGYFSGYVRDAEILQDVDFGFQRTYAIYMSVFAAVLAEISFRGIMQTRMHTALGPWSVIVLIAIINVFSHRWDTDIVQNGLGWFVVLAGWTWLRWLSQSLWPPVIMHGVTNFVVATWIWNAGPIEHATMSPLGVVLVAVSGSAALLLSYRLSLAEKTVDRA